jgi:hypothetical protein
MHIFLSTLLSVLETQQFASLFSDGLVKMYVFCSFPTLSMIYDLEDIEFRKTSKELLQDSLHAISSGFSIFHELIYASYLCTELQTLMPSGSVLKSVMNEWKMLVNYHM